MSPAECAKIQTGMAVTAIVATGAISENPAKLRGNTPPRATANTLMGWQHPGDMLYCEVA